MYGQEIKKNEQDALVVKNGFIKKTLKRVGKSVLKFCMFTLD